MTGCVEIWTRGRFITSSRLGCGTPSMGRLGCPPLEVLVSVMGTISFAFRTILNTFYQSCLESVEYTTSPGAFHQILFVHSAEQSTTRSCTSHPGLCYTSFMVVGVSQITLHLPGCHSLKDKRQVVKSIMARVRQRFEVAIAEVDEQDRWQIAKLGVSCVSNSSQHIDEILGRVRRYIEETRPDVIVSSAEVEIINW